MDTNSTPTNDPVFIIPDDFDHEAYNNGIEILLNCYNESMISDEQTGGATFGRAYEIVSKIFSPRTNASFTRVIRGIVRTSAGISADIITVGAGGDVVVNSVFAVESSLSFINSIKNIILSLSKAKKLFGQLLKINLKSTIPIISKLKLDDGFQTFEKKFEYIFTKYIKENGSDGLSFVHQNIFNIINKITTTVSDWIACLFPDTAGLAGEISKTILDFISQNGFTYIYNLVSIIPNNMQKMITNSFALKKLIRHSVKYLRNLIKNMNTAQMAQIIQALGVKTADFIGSPVLKHTINIGSSVASKISAISYWPTRFSPTRFSPNLSFIPRAQDILVFIIDRYIVPYIGMGVDLFNQLFPLFLIFTLFLEKYPLLLAGQKFMTKQIKQAKNRRKQKRLLYIAQKY